LCATARARSALVTRAAAGGPLVVPVAQLVELRQVRGVVDAVAVLLEELDEPQHCQELGGLTGGAADRVGELLVGERAATHLEVPGPVALALDQVTHFVPHPAGRQPTKVQLRADPRLDLPGQARLPPAPAVLSSALLTH
jgi:hypothetical protein